MCINVERSARNLFCALAGGKWPMRLDTAQRRGTRVCVCSTGNESLRLFTLFIYHLMQPQRPLTLACIDWNKQGFSPAATQNTDTDNSANVKHGYIKGDQRQDCCLFQKKMKSFQTTSHTGRHRSIWILPWQKKHVFALLQLMNRNFTTYHYNHMPLPI